MEKGWDLEADILHHSLAVSLKQVTPPAPVSSPGQWENDREKILRRVVKG